jgi:hypothetical protein
VDFAVTDLFVVGLGFDLVGAWLLARGLIDRPNIIIKRHTTYWDFNSVAASSAARDRVDGQCGILSLIVGFSFQAFGYLLDLADGSSSGHSISRALTALALLILAILGAWHLSRFVRARMLRPLLVEMAHWRAKRSDEPPVRRDGADPARLVAFAFELDVRRQDGESDSSYAKRAFNLTDADLLDLDPQTPAVSQ